MLVIGYHYSSYKNWLKIRKQGLIPYRIDGIDEWLKKPVKGIWVWKDRMKGIEHLGTLLDRVIRKKTPRVVFLRVRFDNINCLQGFEIRHEGKLQDWIYHKKRQSFIVLSKIPVRDIEIIESYNFLAFTT
jgi:hypothetical protein